MELASSPSYFKENLVVQFDFNILLSFFKEQLEVEMKSLMKSERPEKFPVKIPKIKCESCPKFFWDIIFKTDRVVFLEKQLKKTLTLQTKRRQKVVLWEK